MEENKVFLNLLKRSNLLKKTNKYLEDEDREAFDTLLNFLVRIEENLHYSEKQKYMEIAKDFLSDQITADDFSYSFMGIYEGIGKKISQMKLKESLELTNFLKCSHPELGELLVKIYGSCQSFSPDPEVDIAMSDENELKECAQILLLKLQEDI